MRVRTRITHHRSLITERLALILLVGDLLHPLDRFPIQRFLNSDMRHRSCWRGAVPMLFTGRKPDDIARPNFFDRSAFALRPPKT